MSSFTRSMLVLIWIFQLNSVFCLSHNYEGIALLKFKERLMNDPFGALTSWKDESKEANPCSWIGIDCAAGHVVSLHNTRAKDVGFRRMLQDQVGTVGFSRLLPPPPVSYLSAESKDSNVRPPPFHSKRPDPRSQPHKPSSLPPPIQLPPLPQPDFSRSPPLPSPPVKGKTSSSSNSSSSSVPIVAGAVGGFVGLFLMSILLLLYHWRGKRITKTPGLSGQLQRAFVAGIPNLKRSELEDACEDFSNVIGSSSIGTIYKGTLSNGVEIAVISLAVTSAEDWSKNLEMQFRRKIEVLSKVNHKNFVNLIGYCEEEEPFTRLMIFEYAPNGSLFEHLHVREAEHLDWGMRLRVAMGSAYCLDHMHQLTPPVTHPNLNSSSINLSEDYAAKISDFCFWNEVAAPRVRPITNGISTLRPTSITPENNVFSFGLVLLEMMTGRIPHSFENNSLDDWVLEYMRGELPIQEMVDPMLRFFDPDQLDKIGDVIRKCLHSERNRPTMTDITTRLREITGISPDKAVPQYSNIWWAELDARAINGA